jgi:hypothetical protein
LLQEDNKKGYSRVTGQENLGSSNCPHVKQKLAFAEEEKAVENHKLKLPYCYR